VRLECAGKKDSLGGEKKNRRDGNVGRERGHDATACPRGKEHLPGGGGGIDCDCRFFFADKKKGGDGTAQEEESSSRRGRLVAGRLERAPLGKVGRKEGLCTPSSKKEGTSTTL